MDSKKYLDAVDVVCMDCMGDEEDCPGCMVRKTVANTFLTK